MTHPAPPPTEPTWEDEDGLPRRVVSPDGTVWVRTEHRAEGPCLVLRRPDRGEITLGLDAAHHPVLGPCDAIEGPGGEVLALASRVDWRRPTRIPAVDRPGALPAGAGSVILGLLAWQAQRAGSGPLRYAGPYPSPALFSALMQAFRVDPPESAAFERFVADAEARALTGTRTEIAVDFHPAPPTWTWPDPRVCVQRRAERIERVYVDGRAFDRSPSALHRLIDRGDEHVAVIALGSASWCERLRVSPRGLPLDAPRPLPSPPPDLVGTPLPDPVVEVLGEVVVAQAPALLQPALRARLAATRWQWGDPGAELARWHDDRLVLHAGLVSALPTDSTALLGVLVQLVEAPLRRAAARLLHDAWESTLSPA